MPVLDEEQLDLAFAALANGTRRAILARLLEGEASVNELAAPFALTLPAVSKHIKVLETAGLVQRGRRAQQRPCRLNPDRLQEVATWAEQSLQAWNDRLDRMTAYLDSLGEHA